MNNKSFEQLINKAFRLQQEGELAKAKEHYRKALRIQPNNLTALNLLGVVNLLLKDIDNAIKCLTKVVEIDPNDLSALFNRANAYVETFKYDLALLDLNKLIVSQPNNPNAFLLMGNLYRKLNRLDDSILNYDKAIENKVDFFEAYFNKGLVLQVMNNLESAVLCYEKALTLNPSAISVYGKIASALYDLGNKEEAISILGKSLLIDSGDEEVFNSIGMLYAEMNKYDQAIDCYKKSIENNCDYPLAYYNLGLALNKLGSFDESISSYEKALCINPDWAEAYVGLGFSLAEKNKTPEAIDCFQKAIQIRPDFDFLEGMLIHMQMRICDWTDFDSKTSSHIKNLEGLNKSAVPFAILGLVDSPKLQQIAASIWANSKYPKPAIDFLFSRKEKNHPIRIGYFSSDFGDHPVTHLIFELLRLHNRKVFEVFGFNLRENKASKIGGNVKKAFDHFIDAHAMSDREVVDCARELQIDIAIDLGGYTDNARTSIFSQRVSPIQINYLGYIGSMGVDYIDYIISDDFVISEGNREYFTENIIYMPDCYQVSNPIREVSGKSIKRSEFGLPDDGFIFCCFCGSYKILPRTFSSWMNILKKVDGSVLWLISENDLVINNLKKYAAEMGINSERLIFSPRAPSDEYLLRYRLADLFLDTYPYNAGTVASDALWMGLPFVTLAGESFVSRMAGSLLVNIGLSELVTYTDIEYEEKAVELAADLKKLEEIKQKLSKNKNEYPLFDAAKFTDNFEMALSNIYSNYIDGLNFRDVHVASERL